MNLDIYHCSDEEFVKIMKRLDPGFVEFSEIMTITGDRDPEKLLPAQLSALHDLCYHMLTLVILHEDFLKYPQWVFEKYRIYEYLCYSLSDGDPGLIRVGVNNPPEDLLPIFENLEHASHVNNDDSIEDTGFSLADIFEGTDFLTKGKENPKTEKEQ